MTTTHYFSLMSLMATMVMMTACRNGNEKNQATAEDHSAVAATVTVHDTVSGLSLELPSIPATIADPDDMAGFIAIHFWDNLDFADTSKSLRQPFMEQNFVEYLSIMPAVIAEDRALAFETLMKKASVTPETRALIIELGQKYLDDPESPMNNPEYYADFRKAAGI